MGSNKVLKVALGKSQHDEQKPNLHLISDRIKGDVGLFFTTLPRQAVQELFDTFHVSTYPVRVLPVNNSAVCHGRMCWTIAQDY